MIILTNDSYISFSQTTNGSLKFEVYKLKHHEDKIKYALNLTFVIDYLKEM